MGHMHTFGFITSAFMGQFTKPASWKRRGHSPVRKAGSGCVGVVLENRLPKGDDVFEMGMVGMEINKIY